MKGKKGITLIALVITIVLLILAGVTIATLTGDNGLLQKTGEAKNTTQDAEIDEEIRLAWNKVYSDAYLNNYTPTQKANALKEELEKNKPEETVTFDEKRATVEYRGKKISITDTGEMEIKQARPQVIAGQKAEKNSEYKSGNYTAIIPAGFTVSDIKIVNEITGEVEKDETTIETGLVIRDDDGNEFVWIPVGIPWRSDSNKRITLARYEFKKAEDATAGEILQTKADGSTLRPNGLSLDFIEEVPRETGNKNAVSKNINDFISKTNAAGGFWIGRYEARVEGYTGNVVRNNSNKDPNWTGYTEGKLVEKPEAQVFNYITQNKASELSKTMFKENNYYQSDLINSYAWDTATLFLQEYDNRTYNINTNPNYKTKYSNQTRLSDGLKNKGTNDTTVEEAYKDKICNVYDMADNCMEWTTESCIDPNGPCVIRGSRYDSNNYYTNGRYGGSTDLARYDFSFRPILYTK